MSGQSRPVILDDGTLLRVISEDLPSAERLVAPIEEVAK